MTLPVFNTLILPERMVQAGIRGKIVRRNTRVPSSLGHINATTQWDQSIRDYDLGFIPMSVILWQVIVGFFERTRGGAFGFLMRDSEDMNEGGLGYLIGWDGITSSFNYSAVAIGDGVTTTFRFFKQYNALNTLNQPARVITNLYTNDYGGSDAKIFKNGIDVTAGTTYDRDTGIVTFAVAPPVNDLLSWTGNFFVPVHFKTDNLKWELVRGGNDRNRLVVGASCQLAEVRQDIPAL